MTRQLSVKQQRHFVVGAPAQKVEWSNEPELENLLKEVWNGGGRPNEAYIDGEYHRLKDKKQ